MVTSKMHKNADRADTFDKCSGRACYIHDMQVDGCLWARTIRSSCRRGKITAIHLPVLPVGYFTVDYSDIPGQNQISFFGDYCPYLAEKEVNYIGQPVLLLVGPDQEKLVQLAGEIEIEYEEIPAILTLDEALSSSKPPLHKEDNIYVDESFERGDADTAFAGATQVFETITRTGYQEHLSLEPQGMIAIPNGERIEVYGATQGPHSVKNCMATLFGWDKERFRIVQTTMGGGFGGKIEISFLLAGHVALAAHKSGKPVKLIYDRCEDMLATTKRHPSKIRIRTARDDQDKIVAADIDVVFQAGGYALSCLMVLDTGLKKATGVYHFPAVRVRGRAVATNNVMPGAFRGFGGPQVFMAIETHMNALARHLDVDGLNLKSNYLIQQHDTTVTGGKYHFHVSLPQTIEKAVERSDYHIRKKNLHKERGKKLRGIGQALFTFGAPFSLDTNLPLMQRYMGLKKDKHGMVYILSELVDMGQGLHTALRKIVAETLEIPLERVIHNAPDTDVDPEASITGASMSIVLFGKILKNAAERMKPRLSDKEEVEIIEKLQQPEHLSWDADKQKGDPFHSYVWGTVIAEVEVDTLTWQVRVVQLWNAMDVGVPIDRRIIRGQIEGGNIQGLGFGLLEGMELDRMTTSLSDYLLPTSLDVPPIDSVLIENPYPAGPFGAKCVGEPPIVGVAPAIADGVANACGFEVWQLPLTPEYLLGKHLEKKDKEIKLQ